MKNGRGEGFIYIKNNETQLTGFHSLHTVHYTMKLKVLPYDRSGKRIRERAIFLAVNEERSPTQGRLVTLGGDAFNTRVLGVGDLKEGGSIFPLHQGTCAFL